MKPQNYASLPLSQMQRTRIEERDRLVVSISSARILTPPERVIDFDGSKPTLPNGGEEFYQE
jgi:hypothetical protein